MTDGSGGACMMRAMRLRWSLFLVLALALTPACNRPSEDECRRAVDNIQRINEIGGRLDDTAGAEAAVRKCRAQGTKETVQCWLAAKTAADLESCEKK